MPTLNISEDAYNEIKMHILFFISEERFYSSTLYDMIKISPGKWFDIEEFAYRKSVRRLCSDLILFREIIKTISELEYNESTGQIRIRNINIIDDIVNERTVIFYSSKMEFDEDTLLNIITENCLTKLIVRFLKGGQIRLRRDLKPLYPILQKKIHGGSDVVILKMSTRMETYKIKKIISDRFPETKSLLAITNFFSDGCLSINKPLVPEGTSEVDDKSNSVKSPFISTAQSVRNGSLIVSNYIFRCNEYAIILDYLIENNLKPDIFRNFVECRAKQSDMKHLRDYVSIPQSFMGCFSILTYYSNDQSNRASKLIKSILPYLDVKVYRGTDSEIKIHKPSARSSNSVKSFLSDNTVYCKSTCSSISENQTSLISGSYESLENVENISDQDKFNDDIINDQIPNNIKLTESLKNIENISDQDNCNDDIINDRISNNIKFEESLENGENISDIKNDKLSNNIKFEESLESVENISDQDKFSDDFKNDKLLNNIKFEESLEKVGNISDQDKFSDDIKNDQISNNIKFEESLENIENMVESDVRINDNVQNSSEIQSSKDLYINSLVSDECPISSVHITATANLRISSNVYFNERSTNFIGRGFSSNNFYEYPGILSTSKRNGNFTRNRRRRK